MTDHKYRLLLVVERRRLAVAERWHQFKGWLAR